GWTSWQASRAEARGAAGPSLHRQLSADTGSVLLSEPPTPERFESRFREEVFRKRHSSLAHVRRRWAGQYDLHVLPADGHSFKKRNRSEAGLHASGQETNAIKRAAVDGDRPDFHVGHLGPYQWQESIRC